MKHKFLLLLPLLGFATADTWQPFALDKQIVVQLPVAPTEMKEDMGLPAGAHVFVAHTGNDYYQLLGPIPIESSINTQDAKSRQQYYDGMVEGMVKDEGNTLLSRKVFPTALGEGVAITYEAPATDKSKAMVLFSYVLIAKQKSYSFTFFQTAGDTVASAAQRRRFFDSITVKP